MRGMETIATIAAEWWRVGLGIGVGGVVAAFLWRWALEDLVLSSIELPTCERTVPRQETLAPSNPNAGR